MLQIQCDMLKSIWYIIHAVLVLIRGRVQTSSAFCQVSGFFLSFSTEASGSRPLVPRDTRRRAYDRQTLRC